MTIAEITSLITAITGFTLAVVKLGQAIAALRRNVRRRRWV